MNCDDSVNQIGVGYGVVFYRTYGSWICGLAGKCVTQEVLLTKLMVI